MMQVIPNMSIPVPIPTPIYRLIHVDNLDTILVRGFLHSPNHTPQDGLPYTTIHNANVQHRRANAAIPCGPCGSMHDYVPFYFGYLSPMLLQLKTGQVAGYSQGQSPLIYLVSSVDAVQAAGCRFVFSDGHGIATFTHWFERCGDLDKVDWSIVHERYWKDTTEDPDRQRRKQAEFLVYKRCPLEAISEIGVLNQAVFNQVTNILQRFQQRVKIPVRIRDQWYYY